MLDDDDVDELRGKFEESLEDMNSSENSIDSGAFTTDDPVVVIKPVAVYW